ncbi:Rv2175c family DNA-binding protein [Winogradskya consettensis]|uniref:Transcriptional regulator n=2 Tax=Winogradskya TaxID=3240235 RepID=A0A919W0U1_9ACTN|nr:MULTISPECIES: Rv2175c family DNA-binding protein [Actinoplanes]GIE17502.1 transcriptional regulator [Actinoplanes humidus]GIM84716.1 transcriptional regulator [Actinoplanes consettensis]
MTESVTAGQTSAGPTEWANLPDIAEQLGVSISKVHQMIRDGQLLAVRRDGVRLVPAELVANDIALKHLPGILTLLRDAGYNDEEAIKWLYEPDESLGGNAAKALGGDWAREVKRRAQALGF